MATRMRLIAILLGSLLLLSSVAWGSKRDARIQPVQNITLTPLGVPTSFAAAEACTVGIDSALAYYIEGWVTGQELYKAYINPNTPNSGCPAPYPYAIKEVSMAMHFTDTVTLIVSVDIESVDNTSLPGCNLPGALITVSKDWQIKVPAAGGYMISVPLDSVVSVNGPFFAGFFIGNALPASCDPAVFIDAYPELCKSFNIWDTAVGFVDLANNDYYDFPGNLAMYAIGAPGGSSGEPPCCTVAPPNSLDFGTVPVGQTKDLPFTITNCGTLPYNGNVSETCAEYSIVSGGGTFTLGAGQSREVTIRFAPTGAGLVSCQISTGISDCPTILANGTGGGNVCCQVTPGVYLNYGTVAPGSSKDDSLVISNCGGVSLTGTPSLSCPDFSIISGGNTYAINPGGSKTIVVRYTPSSTAPDTCILSFGNISCGSATLVGNATVAGGPQIVILEPSDNEMLYGSAELWAIEATSSETIDHVSFEYSRNGTTWTEIGRDYDGAHALRDGVNAADPGTGYSLNWDFSGLAEGVYTLRATVWDDQNRSGSAYRQVTLEPTPPIARIVSPANGTTFCSALNVLMTSTDENLSNVQLFRNPAQTIYAVGMPLINQQTLGDNNGNPNDGNFAFAGEFGDYYSGPAAAAAALSIWNGRGFTDLLKNGGVSITVADMAEALALLFVTRGYKGTSDEHLFNGLKMYCLNHGDQMAIDYLRKPDYFTLRTWAEDEQRTVILGLGGTPGLWVAVNGFSGWKNPDNSFTVSIMNPLTGTLQEVAMRQGLSDWEIYVIGSWHSVDIMVSMVAKTWTVTRPLIGADLNPSDGLAVNWTPSGLTDGSLTFVRAVGKDANNFKGNSTVLLKYLCSGVLNKGDYDGDGLADLSDFIHLLNFVVKKGPEPEGGGARADANCDNYVNIADVVYYMNYLFGGSSEPCY